MKKKLLWIGIPSVLTIAVAGFIFFNMKNGGPNQDIIENIEPSQEAIPYHGTVNDYIGWDYLSEKHFKCYDISGNLIENPKYEQWDALNCYLHNKSGQIIVKASATKEALEGDIILKTTLDYYYENGKIMLKTSYINGEQNGEEIAYYEDGETIEYKGNYLNGQQDGVWIRYDKGGQMRGVGSYKNGEQNGKRMSFYENGQKEREVYFTNGLPNGEFIKYYENGNIKEKGNYNNGVLEGKIIDYYENGQIGGEATFKDGNIIEEYFYDESGKTRVKL